MESTPEQSEALLHEPSSVLSDNSFGSHSTIVVSPTSSISHKSSNRRLSSIGATSASCDADAVSQSGSNVYQGLGITNLGDHNVVGVNNSTWKAGLHPSSNCSSTKPLDSGRSSLVASAIFILSTYSTVFSGIWLILAIQEYRFDSLIKVPGILTPKSASVLCTAFAKSIEVSFVAVFITLLGQVLSKRAISGRKSITLADMSMRSWILQPGTMLTHWESVRCAAPTTLGIFALLVAVSAVTYTTASDALVAPRLKLEEFKDRRIGGKVATTFANTDAITNRCTTPIQAHEDTDNGRGGVCIQIEHSGEAYHNYMQYLGDWVEHISSGNGSKNQLERPAPVAMLYDNTTVKGSWIDVYANNMTDLSRKHNRIVNNITMAMPHSGVIAAARDPHNRIMQPSDFSGPGESLQGLGEYSVKASILSPTVNVLCAELTSQELVPMVYSNWSTFRGPEVSSNTWPSSYDLTVPGLYNHTAVDDLFAFYTAEAHPIFSKLPLPFNTVFNYSYNQGWGPDSVYLLVASETSIETGNYTMCSLKAAVSRKCSTVYRASMNGGSLSTNCEPHDTFEAMDGRWDKGWAQVAINWGLALSLNAGITDGQATNAHLLSQLIPTTNFPTMSKPTISEALAVLAGCTLLLSSLESPFVHDWNYSVTDLKEPQLQYFDASIQISNYRSGATTPWQNMFFVVLAFVFVANICCFIYFVLSGGLMTDFTEPQNLFCLSLLSPPNEALKGACGGGPGIEHFGTKWNINLDPANSHLWLQSSASQTRHEHDQKHNATSRAAKEEYEMAGYSLEKAYNKIRENRMSKL